MEGLNIPLNHILLISSLLFVIGMLGLMIRRNIIFILMSLEVMLNSAALAFVAAGASRIGGPSLPAWACCRSLIGPVGVVTPSTIAMLSVL